MVDRHVRIMNEDEGGGPKIRRVSELRERERLVIIGEPGIGKSTVLRIEAAIDGVEAIPVRAAAAGFTPAAGGSLYLDALDEFRADGGEADKIWQVAKIIRELASPRWRLTCRAEDWRSDADRKVVGQAGGAVTVVQLLPLSRDESAEVLAALGEADPAGFISEAGRVGASGLLESPLSLKLLRDVVTGGQRWPTTRFDLFTKATRQFTFEHDPDHAARVNRSTPDAIGRAAEKMMVTLLATGARAIWRSQRPSLPDVVPAYSLDLAPALVGDTLDTPMFVGVDDAFEPMHRSFAEFLAARSLASAVRPADGRAALPLGRALALLTSSNGTVPSELRGVHAWLAAHLAQLGDAGRAQEVIERDPIGILAYGDPAAFDHPTRERLFTQLDNDDPYFLGSETIEQSTILGGLAADDMAMSFLSVLNSPPDTHKLSLVFTVLEHGRPLEAVRPTLRAIALDPAREEWQRDRAARAWLAGEPEPAKARRALLIALESEAPSVARETLRAALLAALPEGTLTVEDVTDVLAAFLANDRDNVVMRLYPLRRRLVTEPMPALFAQPLDEWLPGEMLGRHRIEVSSLMDAALAALIKADDGTDADRLWQWICNAREDQWEPLDESAGKALDTWLSADPARELRLFDAIVAAPGDDDGAYVPAGLFEVAAARPPGPAVVAHLRARADAADDLTARHRLASIAVEVARHKTIPPGDYFAVLEWVSQSDDHALAERLTVTSVPESFWTRQRRKREVAEKRDAAQRAAIEELTPRMAGLRDGSDVNGLEYLAQRYFQISLAPGGEGANVSIESALAADTTDHIAAAAAAGFVAHALASDPMTAGELGGIDAAGDPIAGEQPTLLGARLLFERSSA